jgi:hypothetical protein
MMMKKSLKMKKVDDVDGSVADGRYVYMESVCVYVCVCVGGGSRSL